jgi:hypothetical protein
MGNLGVGAGAQAEESPVRVYALPRARAARVMGARSCRYQMTFARKPILHRSCQTWAVPTLGYSDSAEELARELGDCRQRGIEGLDRSTHNQTPVTCPNLERLAADYTVVRQTELRGRIAQIKGLLRDALTTYQRSEPDDARLIRDLFFGTDTGQVRVRQSPTSLLQLAQDSYGEPSENRFREIRNNALRSFAEFLFRFTEAASVVPDSRNAASSDRRAESAAAPSRAGASSGFVLSKLEAVLRFSYADPGATDAVTVEEHRLIIDQHGRCWWGWFKATHDDDHTSAMAERLRDREVGLWGRAEGLFYVAQCAEVMVGDGGPIDSPEKDLTPAYYRDQPYPAWLSLRSIRESDYEEFVQRFGELPGTQATVYWDPQPIPEPLVAQAAGDSILHLADMRFGRHHRWSTVAAPRRSFVTTEQAIGRALLVHDIDLTAVGVVIICGNFGSGEPTAGAYSEALAFIDGLCEQLPNVSREHVVIVPGADDLMRPGDRERSHQELYRKFHGDLYGTPEVDLIRLRRYEFADFRLNVLPVSSVKMLGVDERDDGFFGYGYDTQLHLMQDDHLRYAGQMRIINVVAAHHHLIPTPVELPGNPQVPIQARIMLGVHDAGSVLDKLSDNRVTLFLHGHLHEARYRIVTSDAGWQTAVCGAGTAGASESWLRQEYRNGHDNSLALYEINDNGISGRMIIYDDKFHRDPPARRFQIQDQPPRKQR